MLEDFGTPEKPLRPSALAWLMKCGVKVVLGFDELEESGAAADTGSVVHAAVAAFHLEPDVTRKVAAAVAEMQRTLAANTFPKADPNEARLYLEPYVIDPRNVNAEFATVAGRPAIELKVDLKLQPHALDPTGEPIAVRGTLDQIRIINGVPSVCDLKTGSKLTGWEMLHDYALQQAAYVLAARASGFPNAEPGQIIRCYGYRTRGAKLPTPDGVFWQLPFDAAGASLLLDHIRLKVALIRRGEVDFGPGTHCNYCPQKGLDSCIPNANRKLFSLPMC